MNTSNVLKQELTQWIETYWATYLKGDLKTWATFLRDDYRNIGGTKEEIWNSKQEIIDYTSRVMDQMIGTVEFRNREIDVIPYGPHVMLHEFTDMYLKIAGEWAFYGPFRMSSLLEKTEDGWVTMHQHGSYPDMKAMEGEAFSIDALKAENARLLEAVKARTMELEIEAALERVRAASMAMRDSSALSGIIYTLYGELTKLDAKLDRAFIMVVNPENKGITWWMAGQEGLLAENGFFVQMNPHPSHLMYLDYCKQRKKKWTYLFEGKEKRDWDRFGFSKTELAKLPEPIKAFMSAAKKVHLSGSSDQFGSS
ncbi:MAG: nuclear transport factor 2 family protein [Haliscomenobacter sp.]|nr:nuclear transport factor 2 family protein [Haliscomenobacter sp.]